MAIKRLSREIRCLVDRLTSIESRDFGYQQFLAALVPLR
jgi:hypothetical protein